MTEHVDAPRRTVAVVATVLVAAAVAFGTLLRVMTVATGSLWLDELWTLDAISRSYQEMVGSRLVSDQSPPAWTSLSWLWLRLTGTYDATVMRSLPLVLGLVGVAAPLLGAVRMRRLRPQLLVMAALTALSLIAVQYSVEMRAYAFTMAMGSVATVIWAGLLTGSIPRTGRWIFAMALAGAVGGFAHYYGNLLYVGLLAVLAMAWLRVDPPRPLYVLAGWGALSLVPVGAWYVATRRWSPGIAVAPDPGLGEIEHWTQYAFAPVTNLLSGQSPGYADGTPGTGLAILLLVALALAGAVALGYVRGQRTALATRAPGVALGVATLAVVAVAVGAAWVLSLLLPPSMNARNLSAVVPALFLATACAATAARRRSRQWTAAALVVGVWLSVATVYTAVHGVSALAPPWQQESGYRAAAELVMASQEGSGSSRLVGLKQAWDWHGDWDAVVRSETGAPPADPTDPEPLPVTWVLDASDPALESLRGQPLVAFAYASDARADALLAWAQQASSPCELRTFGGPGVGKVVVADCRS